MRVFRAPDRLLPLVLFRVLPLALCLLLFIWVVAREVSKDMVGRQVVRALEEQASHAADVVSNKLSAIIHASSSLAQNTLIVNGLMDAASRDDYLPPFFSSLRLPGPGGEAITLTDYRGRSIASNRNGLSYRDAAWVPEVMRGSSVARISVEGLLIVEPVLYSGHPKGMIVVEYPPEKVTELIDVQSKGGAFAVIDGTGRVLVSTDAAFAALGGPAPGRKAEGWMQVRKRVPGFSELTLVTAAPVDLVFAPVRRLGLYLMVAMFFSFAVLILGVFLTAEMATHPLHKFIRKIRQIRGAESLAKPIDEEGPAEFRGLAKSFNRMARELQRQHRELERGIAERRQAEEEAKKGYQAQHVLNSILGISLEDIDLSELLERSIEVIISAPFLPLAPRGAIFLIENNSGMLELKAKWNLPRAVPVDCAKVPLGQCYCGRVAQSGRMEFSDRLDHRHETIYEGLEPHGHYVVPIISKSATMGVLLLYLPEGHRKDEREAEFLQAVANTLAGVIERRRAEDALNEAHQELQRTYNALERAQATAITTEKLAALGRLTAGATHEILNPLNIINLILYMLINETELPEEVVEDLRMAEEQTGRIFTITKGLLHFSRQQPPERLLVDINDVVRRTLALVRHDFKLHDIVLDMNLSEGLPRVLADGDQLQQVVFNLLTNARDAMPRGGTISLITRAGRSEGRECVIIRVEDTGRGIPRENMDKLFEPFFTTKEVDKGTGLGLAICQGIVEAHGGTIWAENLPGGGAAFVVRLFSNGEGVPADVKGEEKEG